LIQFDFEDRYSDDPTVGSSSSRREGAYLSAVAHVLVVALILFAPQIPWFRTSPEELEQRRQELLRQQQEERARQRFVFVQPRVDTPAPTPPPRPELSDLDRRAQAPEAPRQPQNPLPFSRGNSTERTESAVPPERARVEEPPQPAPEPAAEPPKQEARLPDANRGLQRPIDPPKGTTGALRDALRDLQKYVQNETFNNPQGGAKDPGQAIQFDTKGVEFGPWVRRFVQRVRRNWFVPEAAFSFRGRVVVQFNIHRDGHITDVQVVQPSEIAAFNRAAYNAILGSNPVEPLPAEYPDERAFFTVTFYYNESPDN
jgi:TonB family protein